MACKNCPTVEPPNASLTGLAYRFTGGDAYVEGLRGKRYPITAPLIFQPHRPRGGWRAEILIHGTPNVFSHTNPYSVFTKVQDFLNINELPSDTVDIWLNLNLQWLSRAPEKYQHVKYADLFKLATPNY